MQSVVCSSVLSHATNALLGQLRVFKHRLAEKVWGKESRDTLACVNNLAILLEGKGDFVAAEPLYLRTLEMIERILGPEHPNTIRCVNNLANLLTKKGDMSAEPLYRRALEVSDRVLGPDHPQTFQSVNNFASFLSMVGRSKEAIPLQQRNLDTQEKKIGSEHPDFICALNQHSHALRKGGLVAEAEPFDRRAASISVNVLGEVHPLAIHRRNNLVLTLIMLGKLEEARQILAANWCLNAEPHANTTPRIAFLRHVIALLESQPATPFLGQVKSLLTGPELPVASGVAVPWDIAYFIEFLKPKLGEHHTEFLTALVAAMNDRAKVADLERFDEWKNQTPVALDVPWPGNLGGRG